MFNIKAVALRAHYVPVLFQAEDRRFASDRASTAKGDTHIKRCLPFTLMNGCCCAVSPKAPI